MEEPGFPRGRGVPKEEDSTEKGSKKRSSSKRRPENSTDDFLFGSHPVKKHKKSSNKSRPSSSASSKQSLLPLGGGAVVHPSRGQSYIEALGFSKLAKGVKLLACVREVHEDLAVLSLPNFWTGYMLPDNKNNVPCDTMLAVGQFLSVVVVKATQEHTADGIRRRIQVTCLPSAINPKGSLNTTGTTVRCQIRSIEDHGILMDLSDGRRGFLHYADIQQEYTTEDDHGSEGKLRLVEGRILDCVVQPTSNKESLVLPLALLARHKMAQQMVPANYTPTLSQLQPGMLMHAKVEKLVRNGLCVTFCGNLFRGAIHVQNLGGFWVPAQRNESTEWRAVFDQQRSLTARITAVDPATKTIRLSLQSHLLNLRKPVQPAVGSVVEQATVIRLDPGVGALLALPSVDDDDEIMPENLAVKPLASVDNEAYQKASFVQAVYVHISKALDKNKKERKTPEAVFASAFAPSTTHTVRIVGASNLLDGIASGATAPSIVQAHVLTHADLQPGNVYRQVPVCAQTAGGSVLVDLGTGVRGLIPQLHLFDSSVSSDYRRKMQKAKYSVGAKVDVRVLSVDRRTKKCMLTAKKSLVKAERVIVSFENVKVGELGTGFVSKVDDQGLSVTFFNGVYGRITARSLATELGIEDHTQDYSTGDVVQCRVTNIKRRSKRKTAALDDSDEKVNLDDSNETKNKHCYCELTLSLKVEGEHAIASDENMDNKTERSTKVRLRAGAIIPAKAMRIVQLVDGKEKQNGFVPGYAIVRIKSKHVMAGSESEGHVPYVECKLPYDQLLDHYRDEDIETAEAMDAVAETMLTAGKKINREGFVLYDPNKTTAEYYSGTGSFAVVSIRPKLVKTLKLAAEEDATNVYGILPGPDSSLFKGAVLHGYVAQVDKRHGAFVRYLNGLTGLIPKQKGGLLVPRYRTLVTEVLAVDSTASPPKLLVATRLSKAREEVSPATDSPFKIGDVIKSAVVSKINFHRVALDIDIDGSHALSSNIKARMHCTMAASKPFDLNSKTTNMTSSKILSEFHPFHQWQVGKKLSNLTVVSVERKDSTWFVELTNRNKELNENGQIFFEDAAGLTPGQDVSGIAHSIVEGSGLWVEVSPGLSCYIPALEFSTDLSVLSNLKRSVPIGCRLECKVLDKATWRSRMSKYNHGRSRNMKGKEEAPFLSVLYRTTNANASKPTRGDLVVGRINRSISVTAAPALMLHLRGGFVGRCCVTELEEPDEWINMPLGREVSTAGDIESNDQNKQSSDEAISRNEDSKQDQPKIKATAGEFSEGRFVQCRVLAGVPSKPLVEVSLRASRIEGDLDDDEEPEQGAKVQGYVVATTKKGCFLRLSRKIDGRVMLKELCDAFLPEPGITFRPGRLVVGQVKAVSSVAKNGGSAKKIADLDMRESVLLESDSKLLFEKIDVGSKHKGSVTMIKEYGVFVRIENSNVSGLAHKSECSDSYIKNLSRLYDPGDLVKVLVVKKDDEKKQLGLSMKASHFENEDDSEEGSSIGDVESVADLVEDDAIDSDDDNFVSKLASKMQGVANEEAAAEKDSNSSSDDASSSDSVDDVGANGLQPMDTDVGFDWGGKIAHREPDDSDDDRSEESEEEDGLQKSSHKSRKKQAQRRREEQEIARRETALADGTADDNPENTGDFERLLASSPNSSEIWIRYMAFHLSLADVQAAREVAARAFSRIEFREEREKLNVWCALLTLELKYGTNSDFEETIGRACQQNNPKQVYLRVCELLEKDPSTAGSTARVDEMYAKMCKKFKSKKKVWIANMAYLLRSGRHEEAHSLSKRAMQSLPPYKHIETMSKFAQLVFEHGSTERARTLFDGLLQKYPKRLDLLFVYADKEVKHGEIGTARALFERVANEKLKLKLSDKQMKSFFKKWYAFEENNGTEDTQDNVKEAARQYVDRSK